MFTIGHAHEISFKVNVMGTGAAPNVRLVLSCTPELVFPARRTDDGWACTVTIPTGVEPCMCDLRIEAVINNRLFVPLSKQVELQQPDATFDAPMVDPVEAAPVSDEVAPEPDVALPSYEEPPLPDIEPSDVIDFTATVDSTPADQPAPSTPRISIIQMVADRERDVERPASKSLALPEAPSLDALQKVVEAPPVVRPRIITPLPASSSARQPVKVSMSEIMKSTADRPTKKIPKTTAPVIEMRHELPVRLIKGEVIYE